MLRIVQNSSAASAKSYYSHSDYLSESQELVGQWHGRAAERLGLQGIVAKQEFDALCDNLDPRTGKPLTARTKTDRTTGYDFTFDVPKGVSLAYALGGDERILAAFRDSVRETMEEIEADAKTRVRRDGKQENRLTGNLVWAEFVHKTARPVEGVPDPNLHAHCFCFNATFDAEENRWKAAQFRELKRDAPYYEAAFDARMARRLKTLGYTIARRERSWDIALVSPATKKKFSRRTDQIEKLARKKGIVDPEEKSGLGAKTREAKQPELKWPELLTIWWQRLDPTEAETLRNLPSQPVTTRELSGEQALKHATEHCFEREAVVPERTLLAAALKRGVGDVTIEEITVELDPQGVLRRELDGRKMATTKAVLAEEEALLRYAREGRNRECALAPGWSGEKNSLSIEQNRAITQLLNSEDKVLLLRGGAGTGKTTLMQTAVAGIEQMGHKVFAFAPSAEASRRVLRDEGFSTATTVAELLVNESIQKDLQGQVIWIDEAGLLSTRDMKRVFDLAESKHARIVLSGDWRQHGSVARGGLLRLLETHAGLNAATVQEIRRQTGRYKEAVALLAKGKTLDGFDALNAMGWVHETPDDGERDLALAKQYTAAIASGKTAMAIAPTHHEADRLTAAIRGELRRQGQIDSNDTIIPKLEPLHWTTAERSDPAHYRPGDVIVFHQNAAGHKKGERIVVDDPPSPELLQAAARFGVFREEGLPVAKGDWLRVTAGGKTIDDKHRLNTGAVYRVAGFGPKGELRLQNGWTVAPDFGHWTHGLVQTSHSAQGRTVDQVFLSESAASFGAASQEQFYVSASRGRFQLSIFTNDRLALREAIQDSSAKLTASEFLNRPAPLLLRHRRKLTQERLTALWERLPSPSPKREARHGHA